MDSMIKINLLRDQTVRTRKALALPKISRIGFIIAAIILLEAGAMSVWSYCVHRQVASVMEKRAYLRNRQAHLQKLHKEIDQYRKMKLLHQNRIDLIEQLRNSRAGPVLLLNTVIQSIPRKRNLWLINLTQKPGNIRISGFAQQTEAIPELMKNLTASGIFGSVNLEEIESSKEASRFSLLCTSIRNREVEQSNGRQ